MERLINKINFYREVCLKNADFNEYVNNFYDDIAYEVYNSTAIEGNTIPLGATRQLLNGIVLEDFSRDEKYEIKDLKKAYFQMYDLVNNDLDEEMIKELHYTTCVNNYGAPGEYRRHNSTAANFEDTIIYSDFMYVPVEMEMLVESFNYSKFCELEKVINLKCDFIITHPFGDGNGRMSRLLMNWALLKFGYIPITIRVEDKDNYIDALNESRVTKDYSYFGRYMLNILLEEYEKLVNFGGNR